MNEILSPEEIKEIEQTFSVKIRIFNNAKGITIYFSQDGYTISQATIELPSALMPNAHQLTVGKLPIEKAKSEAEARVLLELIRLKAIEVARKIQNK